MSNIYIKWSEFLSENLKITKPKQSTNKSDKSIKWTEGSYKYEIEIDHNGNKIKKIITPMFVSRWSSAYGIMQKTNDKGETSTFIVINLDEMEDGLDVMKALDDFHARSVELLFENKEAFTADLQPNQKQMMLKIPDAETFCTTLGGIKGFRKCYMPPGENSTNNLLFLKVRTDECGKITTPFIMNGKRIDPEQLKRARIECDFFISFYRIYHGSNSSFQISFTEAVVYDVQPCSQVGAHATMRSIAYMKDNEEEAKENERKFQEYISLREKEQKEQKEIEKPQRTQTKLGSKRGREENDEPKPKNAKTNSQNKKQTYVSDDEDTNDQSGDDDGSSDEGTPSPPPLPKGKKGVHPKKNNKLNN